HARRRGEGETRVLPEKPRTRNLARIAGRRRTAREIDLVETVGAERRRRVELLAEAVVGEPREERGRRPGERTEQGRLPRRARLDRAQLAEIVRAHLEH